VGGGGKVINNISPFNSHVEYGLRTLFLLHAIYPRRCDLDHLSCLDYMVVHSGDFNEQLSSLHAPIPNRKNEFFIRRRLTEKGLLLFAKYCLVKLSFELDGIYYELTDESTPFMDSLSEEYTKQVKVRAEWVVNNYRDYSTLALRENITNSMESTTGEIAFNIDDLKGTE
jgi:hypothetical protein